MLAGRAGLLVAVALVAAGCSSGAGKRSASTTTTTTTVSPSHVVANLGECPEQMPSASLTKLNAGIQGLGRKLVPIEALNARVCSYEDLVVQDRSGFHDVLKGLLAAGWLTPLAARRLEAEANQLPTGLVPPGCPPLEAGQRFHFYFVTFVNDSQRVDVVQGDHCGTGPYNGRLAVASTPRWLDDLQRYATEHAEAEHVRQCPHAIPYHSYVQYTNGGCPAPLTYTATAKPKPRLR